MNKFLKLILAALAGYFAYTFLKNKYKTVSGGNASKVIDAVREAGVIPHRSAGLFAGKIVETRSSNIGVGRSSEIVPVIESNSVVENSEQAVPQFITDYKGGSALDRMAFDYNQNLILPDLEKTGKKRSRLISKRT